jgi:hypothetical protein
LAKANVEVLIDVIEPRIFRPPCAALVASVDGGHYAWTGDNLGSSRESGFQGSYRCSQSKRCARMAKAYLLCS